MFEPLSEIRNLTVLNPEYGAYHLSPSPKTVLYTFDAI